MKNDYKNILIIRTDRLGDVVLTTPAIKALRGAYPDSRISILVAPLTVDLVDGNLCLDEILIDDRSGEHKGFFGFLKLVQMLRKKKFDCVFVFHTKKRTNIACFMSGIPVRIGYKNNKFGFLLNRPIVDARHMGKKHEAQYCLDVLKIIGVDSGNLNIDLPVREDALRWVGRIREEYAITGEIRLIAIHPGASDPSKRWPEIRFAELIDTLSVQYDAKIILIGASNVEAVAKEIISLTENEIINLVGKTTVGQLAGLLSCCDILVSNDSGPVHVAAGVGTPVVSIFTRNQPGINPQRWCPLGEKVRVVSVSLQQSMDKSFKKAKILDQEYSELIATKAVLEAVDSIYKLC